MSDSSFYLFQNDVVGTRSRVDVDQDSTYSGDGSNPDSGKGPSEEGDNSITLHQQNQGDVGGRRDD